MISRIANGRTDLVLDHLAEGGSASATSPDGVSLIRWCAYYGNVTALRDLLAAGESLTSLGTDALHGAAFHGHWQLCQFLLEQGADPNAPLPDTGETPLHAALCTPDRTAHDLVLKVLLAYGADPNRATRPGVETGGFMRDCRTKAETPLHRAAAFGTEETVQLLLDAGAALDAKDMNGDSPLSWASGCGILGGMHYDKDGSAQEKRASTIIAVIFGKRGESGSAGAEYDVDAGQVIVKVHGREIASLGPTEWDMSDEELRAMLATAVLNEFGSAAEPFREPRM